MERVFIVYIQPQWFTNMKDTASGFAPVHSDFVKYSCELFGRAVSVLQI